MCHKTVHLSCRFHPCCHCCNYRYCRCCSFVIALTTNIVHASPTTRTAKYLHMLFQLNLYDTLVPNIASYSGPPHSHASWAPVKRQTKRKHFNLIFFETFLFLSKTKRMLINFICFVYFNYETLKVLALFTIQFHSLLIFHDNGMIFQLCNFKVSLLY